MTGISRPSLTPKAEIRFSETRAKFQLPYRYDLFHRESGKLIVRKMRSFPKHTLPKEANIKCCLRFYGQRQNNEYLIMYAKCRYIEYDQRFKFDITYYNSLPTTVFV